jgi:hypothetical protein
VLAVAYFARDKSAAQCAHDAARALVPMPAVPRHVTATIVVVDVRDRPADVAILIVPRARTLTDGAPPMLRAASRLDRTA